MIFIPVGEKKKKKKNRPTPGDSGGTRGSFTGPSLSNFMVAKQLLSTFVARPQKEEGVMGICRTIEKIGHFTYQATALFGDICP